MSNSLNSSPFNTAFKQAARTSDNYNNLSNKYQSGGSPVRDQTNESILREDHYHKTKLELLLKHNSQLLNENAQLSELVNQLRAEVQVRTRRQQTQFSKINNDMGSVMVELKAQQEQHQGQLERLLSQVSKLHDQCHKLEVEKTTALRRQQEHHERELVQQVTVLRKSQDEAKNLMELQISKLKESIQLKEFQYESLRTQLKGQVQQIKSQNSLLENELQHQRKIKDLQIFQLSRRNKEDMRAALKHLEIEKNVQLRQYQNRILKLKKDVANKDMQLQQQSKKTSGQNQQVFYQLSSIKKEKQYLLDELKAITQSSQDKIAKEKERIAQLSSLEKQNLQTLFKNQKQALMGQRSKLILLSQQKGQEIKRLYETIYKMKSASESQRKDLKNIIEDLRAKLKETQRFNQEQSELLKIKMAQLHRSDIQCLQKFYQNEVSGLHTEVNILRQSSQIDREKIYKLLQDNDELRKNFQIQISKQKAKIQDMKVKFAAARLQFKEQITSLGTKMELTSQSLVRETEQKQRGAQFFEAQKRKFYQLIQDKDKQIQSMHEMTIKLKELNQQEIAHQNSQIRLLRDSLAAKDQQIKQFKASIESQYERKSMKFIEESKKVAHPDEELEKECNQLNQKLKEVQQQNFKHLKQIQFLMREKQALQKQLGLKAGFLQSMQLQSMAAIQDEKSKIKVLMGKSEVAMRDYYEAKVASLEKAVEKLQKELNFKQNDLREVVGKYNHVQKKLKQLLEAQDSLTDLENKIIHLGLDQNLVKNMAELFTPPA